MYALPSFVTDASSVLYFVVILPRRQEDTTITIVFNFACWTVPFMPALSCHPFRPRQIRNCVSWKRRTGPTTTINFCVSLLSLPYIDTLDTLWCVSRYTNIIYKGCIGGQSGSAERKLSDLQQEWLLPVLMDSGYRCFKLQQIVFIHMYYTEAYKFFCFVIDSTLAYTQVLADSDENWQLSPKSTPSFAVTAN